MVAIAPPPRTRSAAPADLRPAQLAWLAAAVYVVSVGYGALMPLLPGWLAAVMRGATDAEIARHVGLLSGVYSAGVLIGAPLWGVISDRSGRGRILIVGLLGYVASLLLLLAPAAGGVWGIYALRAANGFFVAAVVPLVPALVAEHTSEARRARRFAWLGAVSLLGFLSGPGLNGVADWIAAGPAGAAVAAEAARVVVVLSALLGALMMCGLAATVPKPRAREPAGAAPAQAGPEGPHALALGWLSGAVMFVLAGFELGIVLQGQQHASLSAREVALMFAECSLVMLGVNALLFFTGLLDKVTGRTLMSAGLVLAMLGLGVLAQHRSNVWMVLGVSLTAAGTGLVLPVIAYLAAGAARHRLGATMGGLAAAAGIGQTLGSSAGGWLFGALAQRSFAWLTLPLLLTLLLLLARPRWWPAPGLALTHRS